MGGSRPLGGLLLGGLLLLAGTPGAVLPARPQPLPAGTYRVADAPGPWRDAIARAGLVIVSLQDSLLRELNGALRRGGPAAAVGSCHVDVVGAIGRVERHDGIAAGRTSDRLRNAANAPPPWAAPLVSAYAGRRAADVGGFAVDLQERIGVLEPIAEGPLCASCHGPDAERGEDTRAAIAARYPHDRAVGFRDGEIRGWYWVEIPKPRD